MGESFIGNEIFNGFRVGICGGNKWSNMSGWMMGTWHDEWWEKVLFENGRSGGVTVSWVWEGGFQGGG